jgi:hypothetical protein
MRTIQKQIMARIEGVGGCWQIMKRVSLLGILWLATQVPVFGVTLPGTYTVNLTWNRSPSSEVTGYRIYYGGAAGNYSNSVMAGNVTSNAIPGLISGVTYFFAVVAYNASGVESVASNEIRFSPGLAIMQISIAANRRAVLTVNGLLGHTYEIQAAQMLGTWTVLGTATVGTNGAVSFTDTNAPSFPNRSYRTRDTQP